MFVCLGIVKVYKAPNSVKGRQTYIKYSLDSVALWEFFGRERNLQQRRKHPLHKIL
jgi:hypothetical protein